ncbi:hypothetical protein RHGRI_013909 [Rhododendron griersonianum]|uniref:Uncharacterized protein n=1 Tax=Rhododendron griersonianum TaxID=479676 RepID=A0AAV6K7W6_9ERIC|nr:hypothetical protein RHGRI_013909 [Rhododendron griersonianum]
MPSSDNYEPINLADVHKTGPHIPTEKPSSAPIVQGPKPTPPVVSTVQTTPLLLHSPLRQRVTTTVQCPMTSLTLIPQRALAVLKGRGVIVMMGSNVAMADMATTLTRMALAKNNDDIDSYVEQIIRQVSCGAVHVVVLVEDGLCLKLECTNWICQCSDKQGYNKYGQSSRCLTCEGL